MNAMKRVVAEFPGPAPLAAAMRQLREAKYSHYEVYAPFPTEEIDDLLPGKRSPVGWVMLIAGLAGGGAAYFMQWYAARDYAYNVGGRPLHSWPAFIPITFELTILSAAVAGLVAMLWLAGLPRLHHAVFSVPAFRRASQDRFFIALRSDDPRLTSTGVEKLLRDAGATSISYVVDSTAEEDE